MRVQLCVFSGRRDPAWELSTKQADQLRQILKALSTPEEEFDNAHVLGYRGMCVLDPAEGAYYDVFRDRVATQRAGTYKNIKFFLDPDRSVERFLLETGMGGDIDDLLDQIEREDHEPQDS